MKTARSGGERRGQQTGYSSEQDPRKEQQKRKINVQLYGGRSDFVCDVNFRSEQDYTILLQVKCLQMGQQHSR